MPQPAAAQYLFDVTGVAEDDRLNVRQAPYEAESIGQAAILGSIPWNAKGVLGTGVTLQIGADRWHRIRYGDVEGWVNGVFLMPSPGAPPPSLESLDCHGNEPFWGLIIRGSAAAFESMDGTKTDYTLAAQPASNRSQLWALHLTPAAGASPAVAVLRQSGRCSDGMSDADFPFDLYLVPPGQGPLQGCCFLHR